MRVIRACHELGFVAVAVYSDTDRAALHVLKADEAYRIGPPAASESYLNIDHILDAAKRCRADAIHPGYGFLSENSAFARACRGAGIKFIGPSPESIDLMGSKTRARQQMEKAGVPFVPGTSKGLESLAQAAEIAKKLGYPVMLKAAAGGGGKGMRLVASETELAPALESAQSEGQRSFGNPEVYLEKAIENPRHIEMQVLADEHGTCVYLGERECSIQRRHQKVLEESPSPAATPEMRRKMGEVAVKAAKAAGYTNAGTIEYLVHLQIRIAAGEKLPFTQEDVRIRGHAIECRIYAEDPDNNYFPSPGTITALIEPSGPGIRVDSGIYQGWDVPIEYDPLLAKLIGYGENREQAVGRLRRALPEYVIAGVKTNLPLFQQILSDQEFIAGKTDTGYLTRLNERSPSEATQSGNEIAVIAAGIFYALNSAKDRGIPIPSTVASNTSNWSRVARAEALR